SAREIRNAFLHEADARAGGRGHHTNTRSCGAVDHVDCGDFALRLQKCAADLRQVESCAFGDLAGGSDWVSVERAAPSENGALHQGNVSFTQLPHVRLLAQPLWLVLAYDTR